LPWHYAAENGEQDKIQSCSPFSTASFYGKIGFTIAVVIVGLAVALPPHPRPHPKNRKNPIPRASKKSYTFVLLIPTEYAGYG